MLDIFFGQGFINIFNQPFEQSFVQSLKMISLNYARNIDKTIMQFKYIGRKQSNRHAWAEKENDLTIRNEL